MFFKRLNKKVISTIVIVFSFVTFNLFAESYSASQLIPAEHWIYDSLYMKVEKLLLWIPHLFL